MRIICMKDDEKDEWSKEEGALRVLHNKRKQPLWPPRWLMKSPHSSTTKYTACLCGLYWYLMTLLPLVLRAITSG